MAKDTLFKSQQFGLQAQEQGLKYSAAGMAQLGEGIQSFGKSMGQIPDISQQRQLGALRAAQLKNELDTFWEKHRAYTATSQLQAQQSQVNLLLAQNKLEEWKTNKEYRKKMQEQDYSTGVLSQASLRANIAARKAETGLAERRVALGELQHKENQALRQEIQDLNAELGRGRLGVSQDAQELAEKRLEVSKEQFTAGLADRGKDRASREKLHGNALAQGKTEFEASLEASKDRLKQQQDQFDKTFSLSEAAQTATDKAQTHRELMDTARSAREATLMTLKENTFEYAKTSAEQERTAALWRSYETAVDNKLDAMVTAYEARSKLAAANQMTPTEFDLSRAITQASNATLAQSPRFRELFAGGGGSTASGGSGKNSAIGQFLGLGSDNGRSTLITFYLGQGKSAAEAEKAADAELKRQSDQKNKATGPTGPGEK